MTAEASQPFKDRRTGLIAFGLLLILAGAACLLLGFATPLMLVSGQAGAQAIDPRSIVVSVLTYLALGALFIALGAGSIRLRRWVRPLVLTLAWSWLVAGILLAGLWILMIPTLSTTLAGAGMPAGDLPPGLLSGMMLAVTAVIFSIYIVFPALLVWFYQSRHVRATLEHRDTRASWVDRCPPPVLGLSLALWIGAGSTLVMLLYGFFPFFGVTLTGLPAAILILATAGLLAYLAWASYRLAMRAWWGTLFVLVAMPLAGAATLLRGDPLDTYRRMGLSDEQIEMIQQTGLLSKSVVLMLTLAFTLASVGFMLQVRKHFVMGREASGRGMEEGNGLT